MIQQKAAEQAIKPKYFNLNALTHFTISVGILCGVMSNFVNLLDVSTGLSPVIFLVVSRLPSGCMINLLVRLQYKLLFSSSNWSLYICLFQ